jgi:lipoate-protein ligase A
LTPGKAKIESKGVKSVRARVANLKEFLPGMDVEEFMEKLQGELGVFAGVPEPLPEEWSGKAEALANEKYRLWEWNWGTPFQCQWENNGRFPGAGGVELKVQLVNGLISDVRITGDFFGSAAPLEEALRKCRFRREDVEQVLKAGLVENSVRGLTKEDFLSLINI